MNPEVLAQVLFFFLVLYISATSTIVSEKEKSKVELTVADHLLRLSGLVPLLIWGYYFRQVKMETKVLVGGVVILIIGILLGNELGKQLYKGL